MRFFAVFSISCVYLLWTTNIIINIHIYRCFLKLSETPFFFEIAKMGFELDILSLWTLFKPIFDLRSYVRF